jgi:hypothetical protein
VQLAFLIVTFDNQIRECEFKMLAKSETNLIMSVVLSDQEIQDILVALDHSWHVLEDKIDDDPKGELIYSPQEVASMRQQQQRIWDLRTRLEQSISTAHKPTVDGMAQWTAESA